MKGFLVGRGGEEVVEAEVLVAAGEEAGTEEELEAEMEEVLEEETGVEVVEVEVEAVEVEVEAVEVEMEAVEVDVEAGVAVGTELTGAETVGVEATEFFLLLLLPDLLSNLASSLEK